MAMMTNTNKAITAVNRGVMVVVAFALGIGAGGATEVDTASCWGCARARHACRFAWSCRTLRTNSKENNGGCLRR